MDSILSSSSWLQSFSTPARSSRLKAAVNDGLQCDLQRGLQIEAALFAQLYGTEDQQEAMHAFLEKREPKPFVGR